ncbi:D-hexose-6-phosphate mutarotase [Dasania marina]|uniref:D-hexose-6-phosphate mutarotase n=1 Tax=Dasania marina TaxID=471499 RepID=UPI0003799BD8|nr:D-hexose-6-phosphate mutarotase [Dasania marina]
MNLAQQLQQLYSEFGHLDGIHIELHKELIAVAVSNSAAKALIFLQGAQVAEYQAHGHNKTLWLSGSNSYQQGRPLRGGIPISWPWFGQLSDNPAAITGQLDSAQTYSAHGFARNSDWQLDSINTDNNEQTQLQFSYQPSAAQQALWPYDSRLQLEIKVGKQLQMNLTVTNNGQRPFSYSSALHSYYAVSDISDCEVTGLEQQRYVDINNPEAHSTQEGAVRVNTEVNRLYQHSRLQQKELPPIYLLDKRQKQQTLITSSGSHSTVLWNPWMNKAKQLNHFAADDYRRMLCIETANAGEDIVTLAPQQSRQLSLCIQPQPL